MESKKVKVVALVVFLACLALIERKVEQYKSEELRSITVDDFANHSEIK